MSDTLQTIIQTVEATTDQSFELISHVDSFYNSAWDKLVIVGSLAFAVIGLLVPFAIQWYQKRSLKISEELLKKDVENQMLKLKADLLVEINSALEEKIKIFDHKIEKLNANSDAKTHHIQGNGLLDDSCFSEALSDFIIAAEGYLFCEDFVNLQTVLEMIVDSCLPALSIEEIDDLKVSHNSDLDSLLSNLDEKDEKGTFRTRIRQIRLALTKLPKTINEKRKPETKH